MCSSRSAFTRTYNGQGARKKIRPRMCTYGRGLEHLLTHTYMAGSERRNSIIVVFMGSQPAGSEQNAWSCSSGGLGRNRRWKQGLAYRRTEETDLLHSERGPIDREGCGVPQNGGNGPPTVETGVMLIGRGVAYRKTEEMNLLWSKQGSC